MLVIQWVAVKKLSKYLTQTFISPCNEMICQQVTLSCYAEWPKVADAVIEAEQYACRRGCWLHVSAAAETPSLPDCHAASAGLPGDCFLMQWFELLDHATLMPHAAAPSGWVPTQGGTIKYPVRNHAVRRYLRQLLPGRW
jgi:hypothetical protein